jgi:undecaprenyl-diphosphatase
MEQSHGQALHLQAFAAAAIDGDPARRGDGLDQPVRRIVGQTLEHAGKLGQSTCAERRQGLHVDLSRSFIVRSRQSRRTPAPGQARRSAMSLPSLFQKLRRLGGAQLGLLVLLALAAGGVWAFVVIAGEVVEGDTHALDEAILLSLRTAGDPSDPIGPIWVEETMRDLTALGGFAVLALLTLAVAGYLAFRRGWGQIALLAAAVLGAMLLSSLLKGGFDRPRPDLVPHGARVLTASFPSGHAMISAAVYLTLGAMLASVQSSRRLKTYFVSLAVILTLLIGSSRVYLGVHWPSDVLAGWAAGASWAILVWLVSQQLRRPREADE